MSQTGCRRQASASWLQKRGKKRGEGGAKIGPNAAINRKTYRGGTTKQKVAERWPLDVRPQWKSRVSRRVRSRRGISPPPASAGPRPVSAGGAAARGPSDSGVGSRGWGEGRKVLTSHTDGSTIHNVTHRACAHNTHPAGSGMSPSGSVSQLPQ